MPQPRKRADQPKPIVLQERDEQLLKLIYLCDGLMLEEQLARWYFANHPKNATKRLLALFDNRYLNRNWKEKQWNKFPRLVYWLDHRGFDVVQRLLGPDVVVKRENKLVRSSNPASSWPHHFAVVDFRLKVMYDVGRQAPLQLGPWYTEAFFRANAWRSKAKVTIRTGPEQFRKRAAIPDGFFPIWWREGTPPKPRLLAFLLELDRGTEPLRSTSNTRQVTIATKMQTCPALFKTPLYQETFALRTGRCLMVTTGWERAAHMMELAREYGVEWAWHFTTFEQALDPAVNLVTDPIWRVANKPHPTRIIPDGVGE